MPEAHQCIHTWLQALLQGSLLSWLLLGEENGFSSSLCTIVAFILSSVFMKNRL